MKRVLFLGTGNACRSQMAEAIVNSRYHGKIAALSAGVDPKPINPLVVEALLELGIDASGKESNLPDDFRKMNFDYIVTVCDSAKERCPVFWTKGEAIDVHMGFNNPCNENISDNKKREKIRELRDEIEERLMEFFDRELGFSNRAAESFERSEALSF